MPEFGNSPGPSPSESIESFSIDEEGDVFVEDLGDEIEPVDQTDDVIEPNIKVIILFGLHRRIGGPWNIANTV